MSVLDKVSDRAGDGGDPGWQIVRATIDDVHRLAPLVRAYWRAEEIPAPHGSQISETLARLLPMTEHCACWLAIADGRPVGYLLAVYVLSLEHLGMTAEIDECFVRDDQRGRGLGAALLATAEDEFRSRGCINASMQVARLNEGAQRFYARQGYGARSRYMLMDKALTHGPR
ncbi:MAG: GNAT family N-acetyltransferase [Burkholderiaceae bacterium]